jgi:DNA repair ATPase RecN
MARNQQVWIRAELLESRPEEILNVDLPRLDAQEQHLLQEKRQLQFKQGEIRRALNQRSDRVEEAKKNLQRNTIQSQTAELEAALAGAEAELKAYRKKSEPILRELDEQIRQVSRELDEVYAQKDRLRSELKLYVRVV